jgi:hypothetical protein
MGFSCCYSCTNGPNALPASETLFEVKRSLYLLSLLQNSVERPVWRRRDQLSCQCISSCICVSCGYLFLLFNIFVFFCVLFHSVIGLLAVLLAQE